MGCSENPWKTCPIKEGRGQGKRRKEEEGEEKEGSREGI